VRIVWGAHLHAESDALVVFLRQVEDELDVVGQFEMPGARLHFSPRRTNVELLSQGKLHQVFNRLRNIVRLDLLCSHVRRDVGDQAFSVIRHNIMGRRGGHDHVIVGNHRVGRILRERTLIQAVGNERAGAEIILPPIVCGNQCMGLACSKLSGGGQRDTALQKISALHGDDFSSRNPNERYFVLYRFIALV